MPSPVRGVQAYPGAMMINIFKYFGSLNFKFPTICHFKPWLKKGTCNAQEVACLNSKQPNSERCHTAFMFNFEVLNLEVDCKEAEQKLCEE